MEENADHYRTQLQLLEVVLGLLSGQEEGNRISVHLRVIELSHFRVEGNRQYEFVRIQRIREG